jgi:alpha-L-fucosidase
MSLNRKMIHTILSVVLVAGGMRAHGASEPDTTDAVRSALADPAAAMLARPTPGQIEWADMELEMFLCLDPCTWQAREYDDHSTPLKDMILPKLDVNQWCEAANAFGAKQVVMVTKHTGSFCWWPTETTDYCVRNIPWKAGKGNLVGEVASALRKNGLKMGVYVYSDDPNYAKGIGRGGRTDDPAKQEEWNAKLRQQWTEVLTLCGPDLVHEVWFDGGCVVPIKDIIDQLAPKAQIFNGPLETIRWPGTESGKLPYPCWSSVPANGGDAGVGDPDGTKWCPPECDTVLYGRGGHKWFWSQDGEKLRHTLDELMDIYLKSVGRGGVLLLNATPNTEGLIPEGDMKMYREFGAEIKRRFGAPVAKTQGVGDTVELDLGGFRNVNQSWTMEDLRGGHRIRAYALEGRETSGKWLMLAEGISVGHKKIDVFPTVSVDRLRLRITKNIGTPVVRELAAFHAEGLGVGQGSSAKPSAVGNAQSARVTATEQNGETVKFNLTPHIRLPATYEVSLPPAVKIVSARLLFNGSALPPEDCKVQGARIIIRQTQQVTDQTRTELELKADPAASAREAEIRMISQQ